ncbi:hypothetical protein SBA4_3200019 [Candidatus Sulfopaludibacter sp. SbA4]|nr:hypothetical protein SBA4_3200019 [Candidatus Sulfopaludibacter sp. SbA4]
MIQRREKPAWAIVLRWTFTPTKFRMVRLREAEHLPSPQRKAPHLPRHLPRPNRGAAHPPRARPRPVQLRRKPRVSRPAEARSRRPLANVHALWPEIASVRSRARKQAVFAHTITSLRLPQCRTPAQLFAGDIDPHIEPNSGQTVAEQLLWGGARSLCAEIVRMALEHVDWPGDDPRWFWMLWRPVPGREDYNTQPAGRLLRMLQVDSGPLRAASPRLRLWSDHAA